MATRSLGTLTVDLVAKIGGFVKGMGQAEREADKRFRAIEKNAKKAGVAIGAAFLAVGTAVATGLKSAIDSADALDEMSQRTGIAVETLSRLQVAAKLGAIEIETLQKSVGRLAVEQQKYLEGNADTVALFDALGVKVADATGSLRDADEVLTDLADVFQTLPDGAQKTALAIDLFGKAGQQLIPFLNQGGAKIEEMNRLADDLGITLSTQTAKSAGEFNDQLDLMKLAAQGVAQQVAAELLPDMLELTKAFRENATEGGNVSEMAVNIANGIRGVAWVAGKAYDTIKLLALGIANITAEIAKFWATYTPMGRLLTSDSERTALGNIAAVTLSGAQDASQSILGNEPARVGSGGATGITGTGVRGGKPMAGDSPARSEQELNEQLAEYRLRAEAAAAAAKALADARSGASEAARVARDAEKAAAEQEKNEAEAALKLAEKIYEDQKERRELAAQEKQDRADAIQAGKDVRDGLQFELELMRMTNAEQAEAILLRGLSAEAIAEYGDEIRKLNSDIEANIKVAEGMDVVRDSTSNLFSDLIDGSKSASDAFKDFVANILDGIAQIVARNLTEQFLGSFGSTGGGSSGGGLASLFGAFFGGARAGGGSVYPGKAFLVGEQGPELFIPPAAGNIATAGKTAQMLGRTGGRGDVHFHNYGSTSRRSRERQLIDAGRMQRESTAEFA